jgi:hypothetical protein
VTDLPFKFDQIGYWSELKLEIVEKYGAAYTKAFANTHNLKKFYIDGFSGAGVHVSKTTGAPPVRSGLTSYRERDETQIEQRTLSHSK